MNLTQYKVHLSGNLNLHNDSVCFKHDEFNVIQNLKKK